MNIRFREGFDGLGRSDVDSLLWQGLKRVLGRIMLVPVKRR